MKLTLWGFLKEQWTNQAPVVKADLVGKTVIVLGANTGLGFEAAIHFAAMNPGRLILACRSQSRGQEALNKLRAATGYKRSELWLIDLSDFDSVKSFADRFEQDGGRLDILVENAGVSSTTYVPSKDGWETSFQVNCLSTPLLALLMLPHMLRTAPRKWRHPRHARQRRLLHTQEYGWILHVLNVFFVRALNARLGAATPLIVDAVNPGFCASELGRNTSGVAGFIFGIMQRLLGFTAEEGSRRLVWAAVGSPENPDDLRGGYINQCAVEEPNDFVISAEGHKFEDRLWDELVEMLGKIDSRALTTVNDYLTPTV
ncbi:hypothetical protein C8R43DRAFT_1138608 [Mycena crocata]|nr:hypothetical protein C8R43DRAFT_1138608 [Mycena crocata]